MQHPLTVSRPQHYLIGNITVVIIAYKHWINWISKVISNQIYQDNVLERKHKVAENENTQVKFLKIVRE